MFALRYFKQLFGQIGSDKVGQLSAAFAYTAIFSIAPLLLVVISVAGYVLGPDAVQGRLFADISGTVGPSAAKTIQGVLAHTQQSHAGVFALIIGVIGMLLGATGISSQLQNGFNAILGVVPDPNGGIKRTLYVKIKNVLLVIVGSVAVAASVVGSAIVIGLGAKISRHVGLPPFGLELLNNLASLAVFVLALYGVYRILPDVVVPKKVVLKTAVIISLLFLVGKIILSIVIGRNGTASAYGAASSLITLLLWIYYSGQILFIGAEIIMLHAFNNSLEYPAKKFNLKRTTIQLDASNKTPGSLAQAWVRGFKKGASKQ